MRLHGNGVVVKGVAISTPFVLFLILLGVGFLNQRGTLHARRVALIGICESQKQDRVDNARAWTQAERTWSARALDVHLSHGERDLAHKTAIVYQESANQLRTRLYLCPELIDDGRKVLDRDALLEAQGHL